MPLEAPTKLMDNLSAIAKADENVILEEFSQYIRASVSGNPAAWDAMGDEAHARLRKNYIRWVRGYPLTVPLSTPVDSLDDLKKRPIDWTIGASTPTETFMDNIITGVKIGATVSTLPGMHFPYVSHPGAFAQNVVDTTRKYVGTLNVAYGLMLQ
ncbi:hypothetical protein S7711_11085 [Stachybotrys chartarum IBT 7711]|uniref:Uncharacterized protein n=1 Tax=Stachybotrys chartarum (strain CBS 109288 / IBT 7711) TaxID=1280523 RepID=A0A084B7A5_STACB|nr:hypothetical protein S7711_11085 [Stachybotrys chartarum IBT 7711]